MLKFFPWIGQTDLINGGRDEKTEALPLLATDDHMNIIYTECGSTHK